MKKILLTILMISLLLINVSCNANNEKNNNNNNNNKIIDKPLFNTDEEKPEKFGFPEDDDRYTNDYGAYKKLSKMRNPIDFLNGWTLTYTDENEIIMCSIYYEDNAPVIGIGDGISSIKTYAFYNRGGAYVSHDYGDRIKSIKLSKNIMFINDSAFRNCTGLTKIFIPATVEYVGYYAFFMCNNLTIYCEATSQPKGWSEKWNPSNCPVVWGAKCEY